MQNGFKQPGLLTQINSPIGGHRMGNQPSPLESLASFGIAFIAGAICFATVGAYGQWMRRRGERQALRDHLIP